jgi:hypothetical protein
MAVAIAEKTITVNVTHTDAQYIRCTARVDITIGSIEIKVGTVFYLTRSSKNDGTYYLTFFSEVKSSWDCSCPAFKPCRHIKIVNVALKVRFVESEFGVQAEAIVAAEIAAQVEPVEAFELVYRALMFGTVNELSAIMDRAGLIEEELTVNALEALRGEGRIIVQKIDKGIFYIDTPKQAYRTTFYADFAA